MRKCHAFTFLVRVLPPLHRGDPPNRGTGHARTSRPMHNSVIPAKAGIQGCVWVVRHCLAVEMFLPPSRPSSSRGKGYCKGLIEGEGRGEGEQSRHYRMRARRSQGLPPTMRTQVTNLRYRECCLWLYLQWFASGSVECKWARLRLRRRMLCLKRKDNTRTCERGGESAPVSVGLAGRCRLPPGGRRAPGGGSGDGRRPANAARPGVPCQGRR